jgi:hypothetical protein
MSQSPDVREATGSPADASAHRLQVNVRLQPASGSEQPVFSNFVMSQGTAGVVFIDFGFLEPSALPSVARMVQSGGKAPDAITGRLACRVALGIDSAAQLAQQLTQVVRSAVTQAQHQQQQNAPAGPSVN